MYNRKEDRGSREDESLIFVITDKDVGVGLVYSGAEHVITLLQVVIRIMIVITVTTTCLDTNMI